MPITPQLVAAQVPPNSCYPANIQSLLNLVAQNMVIQGLDSSTFFSYGPTTPPTDAQGMPWIKTDASFGLIGLYTFAGGAWTPQALPFVTGDIMMFNGAASSIIDPWFVCDGISNARGFTTPNLQGSFIIGTGTRTLPSGSTDTANNYTLGLTGGRETIVIAAANIPAHPHGLQGNQQNGTGVTGSTGWMPQDVSGTGVTSPTGIVNGGNSTGTAADGVTPNPPTPTPALPPFYALAYKMYIAPAFP